MLKPVSTSLKVSEVPRLDRLPIYVRAGTILPRQPLVQSTADVPDGPLRLDVFPGEHCAGVIYLDDGHSMAFNRGGYLRQQVSCSQSAGQLLLQFERRDGNFQPWWTRIEVVVLGWQNIGQVLAAGRRIVSRQDAPAQTLAFDLDDPRMATAIRVTSLRN